MKKIFLILISILFVNTLRAQNDDEIMRTHLFQKMVLDIGAIPLSISEGNNPRLSSYGFALGYQVAKKLDIRINADVFNLFKTESENLYGFNLYKRLWGLSLGANYKAFKGKNDSFLGKTSLSFAGKFGVGISPEHSEQESFFYDVATRAYLGKAPYVGLGINHQMYGSPFKSNLSSFHLSFGLDF